VLEILTAAGSIAAVVVAIPTVGRLRLAHSSRSKRMVRKMNNDLTSYQPQTEILLDNADKVIKQLHKKSRQTLREIAIGTRLSEGDVRFVLTLLMPREKNLGCRYNLQLGIKRGSAASYRNWSSVRMIRCAWLLYGTVETPREPTIRAEL